MSFPSQFSDDSKSNHGNPFTSEDDSEELDLEGDEEYMFSDDSEVQDYRSDDNSSIENSGKSLLHK